MISILSDKITAYFIANKVIDESDLKKCKYGLEITFSSFLNIFLILAAGIISKSFLESVVFLLCFIPLRQYTGGYHADTYLKCNLYFLISYILTFIVYKTIPFNLYFIVLPLNFIISLITVILLAPIENPNKLLSDFQKKKYKRNGICLLCILISISSLLYCYDYAVSFFISLVLLLISLLMIFQIIKRRIKHYEKETF